MRIICDACESAPAVLFCAADEAALCRPCDEKVHMCNKLASRHVRVGLANPSGVPCCDICENAPAFFYCEIDGSSLCLQCDMIVHVGGKKTHGRYLMLRQRVVFPGDQPGHIEDLEMQPKGQFKADDNQAPKLMNKDNLQNHRVSSASALDANGDDHPDVDAKMIDLNTRPRRTQGQASNTQAQRRDVSNGGNYDGAGVVPVVPLEKETEK